MPNLMKLINRYQVDYSFANQLEIPGTFPERVLLEMTNSCRREGAAASEGAGWKPRRKEIISFETAKRAIAEIAEVLGDGELGLFADPLRHPQLIKIVTDAKQFGLRVSLVTPLSGPAYAGWEQLVDAGIDQVTFTQTGLKKYRDQRAWLERKLVLRTPELVQIVERRSQKQQLLPGLEIQVSVPVYSEALWTHLVEQAAGRGLDLVTLQMEGPRDLQADYQKQAAYYSSAVIGWDGSFLVGGLQAGPDGQPGGIESRSIWDFWNGVEMAAFRCQAALSQMPMNRYRAACLAAFSLSPAKTEVFHPDRLEAIVQKDLLPATSCLIAVQPVKDLAEVKSGGDFVELPELTGVAVKMTPLRKFKPGEVVDYGSYRTVVI